MSVKIVLSVLVLMNGVLLVANWGLTRELSSPRRVQEAETALRKEAAGLAVERARLAANVAALGEALERLKSQRLGAPAPPEESGDAPIDPQTAALLEEVGITEKPDPLKIPLLTAEEREELDRVWAALPLLKDGAILARDLDALLADPAWNPSGRKVEAEERREAEKLIRDYCYFDRISQAERYGTMVAPQIPRLRESGAFVDYDSETGLPPIEGKPITHAEDDGSGKSRLYFFYPEDHPDLHHHKQASDEQTWLTFVKLHRLVSGEGRE